MSEQEELATGGVIEPGGIPYVSDDPGPEIMFLPRNAQVDPNPPTSVPHIASFTLDDVVYKPSNAFPTPESLREFVEQRVSAYLDEKLDERVGKALDELAREMHEHPGVQPGTRRKGVE